MKSRLLLVLLPALAIVFVPLDASANLDVGSVLSAKTIKADSAGTLRTRTVVLHNHKAAGDGDAKASSDEPEVAYLVSELTSFSGPAPLENPITEYLVWKDEVTGERSFSSVISFEDDAIGQSYTIVTTAYDALGNALGSAERQVVVEARGAPPVALDVLNPPTAAGNVVLVTGDLVQVNFSVLCDLPWLAADCENQKAVSNRNDSIQLMTSDGKVINKTKRGKLLSGLVLLKAKTVATEALVVGYSRKDSGSVTDTADAAITVVADPATAALFARADALEAQVALLQAQVAQLAAGHDAQAEAIAANTAEHLRNWELILDLQAEDVILQGLVTGVGAAGATNAATIAANHHILIKHLMLESDDLITHRINENAANIEANKKKHVSDAFYFESTIEELDVYISGQGKAITTNTSGIATNAANIEANKKKHDDDAFIFESSIEELDEYIGGRAKVIDTNTSGIAANAAAIADGLGSPLANYEGLLREQSKRLVDGEATTMTFAPWGFTLTGVPVGEFFSTADDGSVTDTGYRHLTDVVVTDLTGDNPDIVELALTLKGNKPGIVFEAGATVTFPDIAFAVPGTVVKLFSFDEGDPTGFRLIGTGNIDDQGAVFATVTGTYSCGF